MFKAPAAPPGDRHELVEQYWVEAGDGERVDPESSGRYVVTPGVKKHLSSLARAALLRRHPILLQGPTSSGKTSLVEYLATRTGHRFVRINNHEHTDLQEYLGSYVTDAEGAFSGPETREFHFRDVRVFFCFRAPAFERLRGEAFDSRLFFPYVSNTIARPALVRYSRALSVGATELEGCRRAFVPLGPRARTGDAGVRPGGASKARSGQPDTFF